jgi:hypothetical protein
MKNSENQIQGDCEAEGYANWLKLQDLTFSAMANIQYDGDAKTGAVHQSGVSISVPFGPWVAELQQRLFHGRELGTVELVELEQKVEGQKKSWKKVREFKLLEGWIETMNHGWDGIHQMVSMTVQYTDITFGWGDKVAHYNRSEKS